ncbi:hypothetical protein H5410_021118 [Solanum commersonii]|uniref:Uncharacterized protein n=1 Tax=Solanum commersonii TaxID=4109 RepID=A0A9J5ZBS1_SOLCO|nr:hypothetical protein H5410_021118 [Solanum commersonii]
MIQSKRKKKVELKRAPNGEMKEFGELNLKILRIRVWIKGHTSLLFSLGCGAPNSTIEQKKTEIGSDIFKITSIPKMTMSNLKEVAFDEEQLVQFSLYIIHSKDHDDFILDDDADDNVGDENEVIKKNMSEKERQSSRGTHQITSPINKKRIIKKIVKVPPYQK